MRITELTAENCPPCFAAFHAANWYDAMAKFRQAVLTDDKSGAVWMREPLSISATFNQKCEDMYQAYVSEHPDQNWKIKNANDENLTLNCLKQYEDHPFLSLFTPDEIEGMSALFDCMADVRVIKRRQLNTPRQTVRAHFEGWAKEKLNGDPVAGNNRQAFHHRVTRFLLTQNGPGPVIYSHPGAEAVFSQDGYVESELENGWQIPANTVAMINGVRAWGRQATLHSSPFVNATPDNPRLQTVFDLVF